MIEMMFPKDVRALWKGISKRAEEWSVLDCAPRCQVAGGGAALSLAQKTPCNYYAKGKCSRGESCRFSQGKGAKSGGKGKEKQNAGGSKSYLGKAKDKGKGGKLDKRACKLCGEITEPPHWQDTCPKRHSAGNAIRNAGAAEGGGAANAGGDVGKASPGAKTASSTIMQQPGVSFDQLQAMAAMYLQQNGGGCSAFMMVSQGRQQDLDRLYALSAGQAHLTMIADSGAEIHVVAPKHRTFMYDMQQLPNGLPLDTASGDVTLGIVGTVWCMGIVCKPCILNPHSKHTLLSVSLMERDGWYYQQGGGRAVLYRADSKQSIWLNRSGGFSLLENGQRFSATTDSSPIHALASPVLATDEIEVRVGNEVKLFVPKIDPLLHRELPHYIKDGVLLEHLRLGHRGDHEEKCSTCIEMNLRSRQHRRKSEGVEDQRGQISGDLAGP